MKGKEQKAGEEGVWWGAERRREGRACSERGTELALKSWGVKPARLCPGSNQGSAGLLEGSPGNPAA